MKGKTYSRFSDTLNAKVWIFSIYCLSHENILSFFLLCTFSYFPISKILWFIRIVMSAAQFRWRTFTLIYWNNKTKWLARNWCGIFFSRCFNQWSLWEMENYSVHQIEQCHFTSHTKSSFQVLCAMCDWFPLTLTFSKYIQSHINDIH